MTRKLEWGRRRSDNQPYPKTRGKENLPKGLVQVAYPVYEHVDVLPDGSRVPRWSGKSRKVPVYSELDPNIVLLVKALRGRGVETLGSCEGHKLVDGWYSAFVTFYPTPEQLAEIQDIVDTVNEEYYDNVILSEHNPHRPFWAIEIFENDERNVAFDPPKNERFITDLLLDAITTKLNAVE